MPKVIMSIRIVKVRDGNSVEGLSRSDRGTKFIARSVLVSDRGKTKEEKKAAIKEAVASLMVSE